MITQSTPRLFKSGFSHRVVWADGSKGPSKLTVEKYGCGESAQYNSWVVLKPVATTEIETDTTSEPDYNRNGGG